MGFYVFRVQFDFEVDVFWNSIKFISNFVLFLFYFTVFFIYEGKFWYKQVKSIF